MATIVSELRGRWWIRGPFVSPLNPIGIGPYATRGEAREALRRLRAKRTA